MKKLKITYIIILICLFVNTLRAQNNEFKKSLEHRFLAGFSLGASTPIPIPDAVVSIESWKPKFSPQLGYSAIYNLTPKWGVGASTMICFKGMEVVDQVKYMYTEVVLEEGSSSSLKGSFVGKNTTEVSTGYFALPVYGVFKPNLNWNVRLGMYGAFLISGTFKGAVSDGYLRAGDPTGEKIEISEATFDFSDDLSKFDFGLMLAGERKIGNHFGAYANIDWGLSPIFPSDFKAMDFKMRNIYFTLGLMYRI